MQIPKEMILELLKNRGEPQNADQADAEMPDQVDTEQHQGLLAKFGIDPSQLPGGLGGLGAKFGL